MDRDDRTELTIARPRSFSKSFEEALSQIKRATGIAIRTGAMATMMAAGPAAMVGGCDAGTGEEIIDPLLDPGAADGWLDSQGIRNTDMVSYERSSWHEYYDCGGRGGCMSVAVFLKIMVRPVEGANLDSKRVGVVYTPTGGQTRTAVGNYFTSYSDGFEEWHVRLDLRSYEAGVLRFDAWYQDGLGNTYFDDNNGESHVEAYRGTQSVIYNYQPYDQSPISVGENGVQGRLNIMVADLDYDKELQMVWTTDNWATTRYFDMGAGGQTNQIYFAEDTWSGYERWQIDFDIDGPVDRFEYALVYRHGIVNEAQTYEFWDNNRGYNYVLQSTSNVE